MKKALIVLLVLVLLLTGLFFWKGGHHAVYLAEVLEEWLDADTADQTLRLMVQIPGFKTNTETGRIEPEIRQLSLNADTFWTEHADRPLFGLTAQGMTAWTDGNNLYMDTGTAYALPKMTGLREYARKLAIGMLLYGRVTKNGDTYHISMDTEELELHVSITTDRTIRAVSILAVLPNDAGIYAKLTPKDPVPHPIPREISDAIVRSRMEMPMPLTDPLAVLLPAVQNLLPLKGDLTLGVECGILELAETVGFSMNTRTAELERKGVIVSIDLPDELSGADPAVLGLLLLRNGTFTREGENALFRVELDPQTTNGLCAALVPQVGELGIEFGESEVFLSFTQNRLSDISLTANGEVPFLFTTIPVAFQAKLAVH